MSREEIPSTDSWFTLSQAAKYLGVHFATLRRWADAGEVACLRTPGGRRRFARNDLDAFLEGRRQPATFGALAPLETHVLEVTRRALAEQEVHPKSWLVRSGQEDRQYFRQSGRRLLGLVLQFSARPDGESFLREGRRLGADHGAHCSRAGLSLSETVQAFFHFRRSLLSAIHESGTFGGPPDVHSLMVYQRASDFLDEVLLSTIESYQTQSPAPTIPPA
ncbi:MAG: helix-turn-helix domain-containing protein [Anaerolineae bacterium]|nr:helix-turn-helix domain-containing protein [Anaerolineae bacterium]